MEPTGIESPEELDDAFRQLAEIDARVKARQGVFNADVTKLRTKMDAELKEDLELAKILDVQVREYATEHREELFHGAKSAERRHADLTFKGGAGVLEYQDGQDEKSVIKLIKKAYAKLASTFVKTTESIKKEPLKTLEPAKLAKLGLKVVKEEKFDYKLKAEAAALAV
jgi:phage host-nuclease inhibitor protein Gam